jgi:outer membrane protein assembly factor BamD (BamD/ComL family)
VPDERVARIQEVRGEIGQAMVKGDLPGAAARYLELRRLDPQQVMSRQAQMDLANQLASEGFHVEAADAYEGYLRCYPKSGDVGHVELMLGLIYARYVHRHELARQHLNSALRHLHNAREIELAQSELHRLGAGAGGEGAGGL